MERTEEAEAAGTAETGDRIADGQHAPAGAFVNRAMATFSPADEEKRRGVRRMKLTATGLLLFVAVVYVLTTWASHQGAGPCAGSAAPAGDGTGR